MVRRQAGRGWPLGVEHLVDHEVGDGLLELAHPGPALDEFWRDRQEGGDGLVDELEDALLVNSSDSSPYFVEPRPSYPPVRVAHLTH